MHPIISAYLEWERVYVQQLRYDAWYFGTRWLAMCADRRNWLNEVWLHETGAMA